MFAEACVHWKFTPACGCDVCTDACLPLKVYPYEMLMITSRGRAKLPRDVDRTRLEVSLSRPTAHCGSAANFSCVNWGGFCAKTECAERIHCFLSFFSWPVFHGPGANHKHPSLPLPPLFSPPLFSLPAPLSTWNVLWHLWNGDPGVWQASPVETQRHEKEGQALLATQSSMHILYIHPDSTQQL